jgi:transcriptional regulator with XRE-family HTH domain
MEKREKDVIEKLFDDIRTTEPGFAEFEKTWGALASFLTDYEHLKGLNKLTQAEIAKKCATTQSAISRLERMKGKPTYELLRRLSDAVGGELFITPLADVTITLPYDLHEKAREIAKEEGESVKDLLGKILREGIKGPTYSIPVVYQGKIDKHAVAEKATNYLQSLHLVDQMAS